ncbi:uncharacterized protein LOC118420063 [Branchiostoma floridae]|uniref:Uncharacterized protein LOC118420063 n=1 Tax=Branchiostoma floridae TaxID=7739 RepID=A0A9J7LGT9_BRAFL|nr:uncharacterized protein LOC118420063 [Branchiostoma floridae]
MLGRAFTKIWRHKDSENHYYLDLEGFKSKGPTQEDNVAYCPEQDASSTDREDSNDSNVYEHPEEVSFGYKARGRPAVESVTKTDGNAGTGLLTTVAPLPTTGVNECTKKPCQHGRCVNKDGGYSCVCSPGWTGQNCQQDINECTRKPCQHGYCVNKDGGYNCTCAPGWTGQNCQQGINECDKSPCQHGRCVNKDGGYTCVCSPGWTGQNCQQDIKCAKTPCRHGRCVNKDGGYTCVCLPGWTGQNCQQNINECARNPCQHGRCVNKDGGYKCQQAECPSGWSGHGDHCYKLMKAKVTWTAAKSKCERLGAELASVKDKKENDFIAGLVVGDFARHMWNVRIFGAAYRLLACGVLVILFIITIGVTQVKPDQKENEDGVLMGANLKLSGTSTAWLMTSAQDYSSTINRVTGLPTIHHPGRPAPPSGRPAIESVTKTGVNEGAGLQTIVASLSATAECQSGWSGHGNHCYRLMEDKVCWKIAKSGCERVGAELASVKDKEENDFIADLVVGAPKGYVALVWLGLHKESGEWKWTDGSLATYFNWAPGEPNNSWFHSLGRGENCGAVYSETGTKWIGRMYSERGQWNDNACNWNYPFICKRPKQG